MTKLIRFPIIQLTKKEYSRYKEYCKKFPEGRTYIYYTTELSLGIGYDIICTKNRVRHKNGLPDFGESYENITDIDNLLETF